jgi:hypothetical protein
VISGHLRSGISSWALEWRRPDCSVVLDARQPNDSGSQATERIVESLPSLDGRKPVTITQTHQAAADWQRASGHRQHHPGSGDLALTRPSEVGRGDLDCGETDVLRPRRPRHGHHGGEPCDTTGRRSAVGSQQRLDRLDRPSFPIGAGSDRSDRARPTEPRCETRSIERNLIMSISAADYPSMAMVSDTAAATAPAAGRVGIRHGFLMWRRTPRQPMAPAAEAPAVDRPISA